jgi:hypothetical protein
VGRLTFPASSQAGTRANPRMKLALNGLAVLDPNQQVIAVATLLDQSVARSTALARSASPPPQRPPSDQARRRRPLHRADPKAAGMLAALTGAGKLATSSPPGIW